MLSKLFRLVVLIVILSPSIGISSSVLPPKILISVVNADGLIGSRTFKVNVNKIGYEFLGSVTEYFRQWSLMHILGLYSQIEKSTGHGVKIKEKQYFKKDFFQ